MKWYKLYIRAIFFPKFRKLITFILINILKYIIDVNVFIAIGFKQRFYRYIHIRIIVLITGIYDFQYKLAS